MPTHNFLVYSDGLAIESKKLLLERSGALYGGKFERVASRIAGDPAKIGCPIAKTGELNTTEVYTDPKDNARRYYLPTYAIGQVKAESPPLKRYQVSLEFTTDLGETAIARLKVYLKGCNKTINASADPLPHDVTVSLQYLVSEKINGAGGVSTWKRTKFDEVKQKDETEIEATLHLYSLTELDSIYKVMSDDDYQCQIVVHCEADLALRTLNQIYVRRTLPWVKLKKEVDFSDLKLETLPTAKPSITRVAHTATVAFNYNAAFNAIRAQPLTNMVMRTIDEVEAAEPAEAAPVSPVFLHLAPLSVTPLVAAEPVHLSAVHVEPEMVTPMGPEVTQPPALTETHVVSGTVTASLTALPLADLVTHTRFDLLKPKVRAYPLKLSTVEDFVLPSRYFTDKDGKPAYVKLRARCDQNIEFSFPANIHSYVYPDREPEGEVALVRYQVSHDQTIYQDTAQPSLFYYLPDEFRLTREDVAVPLYRPALQVAFYALSTQEENGTENDGQTSYNVHFTFKAVPYLRPDREGAARDYVEDNHLAPDNGVISFAPLVPESAQFSLTLPSEAGGSMVAEREEADVVFTRHIVDSVILSSRAFEEVFNSMRGMDGETLNGTVRVKLPGRQDEHEIDFSGRLDKMLGPITEQHLVGPLDGDGAAYKVKVRNATESPITLRKSIVRLLADPDADRWVLATIDPGTLPLPLESGAESEIIVRPVEPIENAWSVQLKPIKADVDLDLQSLWLSVLETPGWGDITHQVTVNVAEHHFSGQNGLDKVIVTFNHEEAIAELKKDARTDTVDLTKPLLPYLLRQEEANDYFYRVESYRVDAEGKDKLVAASDFQKDDTPELEINPPLE